MVVAIIVIALAYIVTGAFFWPRFAYKWYQKESDRYITLIPSKGEGVFYTFFHALLWPFTLMVYGITGYIDNKVEEDAQAEAQAKKDAEEFKRIEAILKKERLTQKLLEDAGLLVFERKLVTTVDEAIKHNQRVREFIEDYASKNTELRIWEISSTLEPLVFDLRNDKTLQRA